MNWKNFHIDVSTVISYLLGFTMLYVLSMASHINDYHFTQSLIISIVGVSGLAVGVVIALVAGEYNKRKGSFFIASNFLRYTLAIAVIPHYFYALYYGIDVFNSLSSVLPEANHVIFDRIDTLLVGLALISSLLLLINKTVKWGAIGLLIVLSPILILDLVLGSPFTLRDFSLFNAALGYYFTLEGQFFSKIPESDNFISSKTKEIFTEHFLQSTTLLKFIFFSGIIVFTYQKHILKKEVITEESIAVTQTIEGQWQMRNISYYNISVDDKEMSSFIEDLSNINTIYIDEYQSGVVTIKDKHTPIICELSPSNNKFLIFGLEEMADFKLSGTYSFLSDGQMMLASDEDNITLIFSK